jgi:nucleoside-diphosphate-sugar epimerase
LLELGVELITETFITDYNGTLAVLNNGQTIKTMNVIWAAGVTGNLLDGINPSSVTNNRYIVDRYNKIEGYNNVYAIGGDNVNHITENSPISPTSKKGEVRAQVDRLILDSIEKNKLNAIIARSADFFSGVKDKSILMNTVYDNLAKGKKSQWFCNAKVIHSVSYAPDLGKGTALLGNTETAFNQIWNLPTDPQKITGEEWINLFASEMNLSNKYQVLPSWGLKALGLFIPILKEMYEMRYQYDRDYYFDSSKFNKAFNYTPTSNAMAVKQTVEQLGKTISK